MQSAHPGSELSRILQFLHASACITFASTCDQIYFQTLWPRHARSYSSRVYQLQDGIRPSSLTQPHNLRCAVMSPAHGVYKSISPVHANVEVWEATRRIIESSQTFGIIPVLFITGMCGSGMTQKSNEAAHCLWRPSNFHFFLLFILPSANRQVATSARNALLADF